jgi:hypothetical protein
MKKKRKEREQASKPKEQYYSLEQKTNESKLQQQQK